MKKIYFFAFFLIFSVVSAYSQSAEYITEMLETDEVNFSQIAYLVATHLEFLPDTATEQQAMNVVNMAKISTIPEKPYNSISYKKFAQLCMNAWIKKGGLLYSITKSQRYAFKEMQSLGLIDIKKYPNQHLSGKEALNIMTKCITIYEKENIK